MAEKNPTKSSLEILSNTQFHFENTLSKFQKFHDLVREAPDLYTEKTISDIDTVAISFRDLGKESSSTARLVSSGYLNVASVFYKTIKILEEEDIKMMLKMIGGQAKEFRKVFRAISVWGGWCSGQFHEIQGEIGVDQTAYKKRYDEAVRKANSEKDAANDELQKGIAELKLAKADLEYWRKVALGTSWLPLANIGTALKYKSEIEDYNEAKAEERKDEEEYYQAKQSLKAAKTRGERAKILSDKASDLVETVMRMQSICDVISSIWEYQSTIFLGWSSGMLTTQLPFAEAKDVLLNVANDTIDQITQDKKDMAAYCDAMASIMTGYNYETTAKSPPSQEITIGKLSFVFKFPAAIESQLKEIFD